MRYQPFPKPRGMRKHSNQRLAAARRSLTKERNKHPMFADQFVTETPEERLDRQDQAADAAWRELRKLKAQSWRRARRSLFSLPQDQRQAITQEWNQHKWLPGSPEYLLDLIHRRTKNE